MLAVFCSLGKQRTSLLVRSCSEVSGDLRSQLLFAALRPFLGQLNTRKMLANVLLRHEAPGFSTLAAADTEALLIAHCLLGIVV